MKNKLILISVAISFLACNNGEPIKEVVLEEIESTQLSADVSKMYIAKGKEIAQNTFNVLAGNVKRAMAEGGVQNATAYCNINAGGLSDSLSTHYNASIKRTSHKLRNQANQPTKGEQLVIDNYLKQHKNGEEMMPMISLLENGDTAFFAPIITKSLCLLCHGIVGENISKEDYSTIKKHYPNDEAIDFKEGDLRGIWSITFKK